MSTDTFDNAASALYPPRREELEEVRARLAAGSAPIELYSALIESQCGATDDSQAVESYDGTLGVTERFVADREASVGQLQWDDSLGSVYANPGNVSGVRWCTGTLISANLFLTAGHCFDSNPAGWQVPRVDGTSDPIPPEEIAARMHINFNYQADPDGDLRTEVEYDIVDLVEYRPGGLDVAIVRLAGAPGATFGVGRIAAGDPEVDDMLAIIGHPAGEPKRVEAGPVFKFDGDRIRYDDIDTLGGNSGSAVWHAPSGEIVGVHTNGGCNTDGSGSNFGVRIERIRDESRTVRTLDHAPLPVSAGIHTVRQKSSGRFLDAHEHDGADFSVVTRTAQHNDTQRWRFTPVGVVGTLQQVSSDRFMDAYQTSGKDFTVVTRGDQGNDTQRWVALEVAGELSTYTLQQLSSGRYLDAYQTSGRDFTVVTRDAQHNFTQRWALAPQGDGTFTVAQRSSGRLLDAYQSSGKDFTVVTRAPQHNDTQRWRFTPVAAVYTVQQVSSDRFLDAHQHDGADFSVVTRHAQNNDTQRWVVSYLGDDAYTLQQLSSARFVDAHQHDGADFSVVTRTAQGNNTQRWLID